MKTVTVWSDEGIETLKGCFLCTDWSVFHDTDIDVTTDTITDYIIYCIGSVHTKKAVVVYPNNKPYVTKDMKDCVYAKRQRLEIKTELS